MAGQADVKSLVFGPSLGAFEGATLLLGYELAISVRHASGGRRIRKVLFTTRTCPLAGHDTNVCSVRNFACLLGSALIIHNKGEQRSPRLKLVMAAITTLLPLTHTPCSTIFKP